MSTQPTPTGIEAKVCADIAQRQAHGLAKYGTTVAANPLPLRQWLQHAYEESLDLAIYLKRAMQEMDGQDQTSGRLEVAKSCLARVVHQQTARRDELIAAGGCPECDGRGYLGGQFCGGSREPCAACNGTGQWVDEKTPHHPV